MDEGTRRRDTSVDESEQFSPETEAGIGTTRDFEVAGKFGVGAAGSEEDTKGFFQVKRRQKRSR